MDYSDAVRSENRALFAGTGGSPRPRMIEHELHVEADAICPRCMHWIEPGDFVRRTAYGPHQHETCE